MKMNRQLLLVSALVAVQVALVAVVSTSGDLSRQQVVVQVMAFGWSLLVLAALRRSGLSRRALTWVLLLGCAAMQAAALVAPPSSSDDDYRYVWDAKVQLSGIDPYRYAPADDRVSHLRTDFTFPGTSARDASTGVAADGTDAACRAHVIPAGGCTRINRPTVHTIYPPVAQTAFVAMRLFGGARDSHVPLQVSAAGGVLLTTLLLLRWSRARGRPLWLVAVWALSPLVAVEATNNAHIDWLAALLCVGALLAVNARRPLAAGLAIGAATATKLFPVLLLVMAGRRPWRMAAGVALVLVLGYLPHVIAVGPEVVGYLPGYLQEEKYASGGRYLVLSWLTGPDVASAVAPLVLAVALLVVWWRTDSARPELGAVAAAGIYLAVTTPNYPWYALLLVVLVAASGQLRWLWLCLAPTLTYAQAALPWDGTVTRVLSYVGAVTFVVGCTLWDRRVRGSAGLQPFAGLSR